MKKQKETKDMMLLNSIHEYMQIKKQLEDNYGIINMSEKFDDGMLFVQVYSVKNFESIVGDKEVKLNERHDESYPYSLICEETENSITYETLLSQKDYEDYISK